MKYGYASKILLTHIKMQNVLKLTYKIIWLRQAQYKKVVKYHLIGVPIKMLSNVHFSLKSSGYKYKKLIPSEGTTTVAE